MAEIRVLVVDDSVVIRRLLADIIDAEPDMKTIATASNGQLGVEKITKLNPDVVTLDVEMPVLDGIGTLRELRRVGFRGPVIMFSTLTERGASATLDAMALGAADYVTKPSNTGSFEQSRERVRNEMLPKIRALGPRPQRPAASLPSIASPAPARRRGAGAADVLAIGCSTGGPNALASLVPALPGDLAVPVLITQHMPPVFTGLLAKRLDATSALTVVEAEHGMPIEPGRVYVAPGDYHMTVGGRVPSDPVIELNQDPPENSCRPAVDPMFRSVAKAYKAGALALVLTGMGYDGAHGSQHIRDAGGEVLVQDEASSVVWGMPGAVVDKGAATSVIPLDSMPAAVVARVRRRATVRGVS